MESKQVQEALKEVVHVVTPKVIECEYKPLSVHEHDDVTGFYQRQSKRKW